MSLIKRAITNAQRPENEEEVGKALSPAVAGAAAMTGVSGASYPVPNPSSPFMQTGGNYGANPLPRPNGDFDSLFGPGYPLFPDALDPLGPSGRASARRTQYRVTENIQLVSESPWALLRQIASQVDVVSRCIELVQDAVSGMEWSWGFSRQIINQIRLENNEKNSGKALALAREKYGDELARVQKFWERPDERMGYSFSQWLTLATWAQQVYDGIVVAPYYNRKGELHSLSLIDTSTIKILLDNQGFIPQPPAPAYQQILWGFPRSEFQTDAAGSDAKVPREYRSDQLFYKIRRPRLHTVYGFSVVEECINYASLYQQRQEWMHAEWSHGVTPKGVIKTTGTEGWTPEQFAYFQQATNDQWSGQTQHRQQVMVLRPGMEWEQLKDFAELYNTQLDSWLVMQIGAKFGVPQQQLGIPQQNMRPPSGAQTQSSMDLTDKFALDALVNFLVECVNDLSRRFLGIGSEITMTATSGNGDDSDYQRAQADASDVNSGIRTRNEVRQERGQPLITEPEADELGVTTATGVTFITGQLAAQEAQLAALESGSELTPQRQRSSRLDQPSDPMTKPMGVRPRTKGTTGAGTQPDLAPRATGAQQSGGTDAGSYTEKELSNGGNTGTEGSADHGYRSGTSGTSDYQVSGNGHVGSGRTGGSSDRADSTTSEQERELAAFAKFAKTRIETGKGWRGFSFEHVNTTLADSLNVAGASGDYELIKAILSGEEIDSPIASGIIVRAKDTGRVLLLQRSA